MKNNVDGTGVVILMSHLVITLAILGIYGYLLITGKGDNETLKTVLMLIMGYWFGAIGNTQIRPNAGTQVHHANEVKVLPNNDTQIKEEVKQ